MPHTEDDVVAVENLAADRQQHSMIGHLFGIPSGADAEEESTVRHAIKTGDGLGQINGVVLGNKTDVPTLSFVVTAAAAVSPMNGSKNSL